MPIRAVIILFALLLSACGPPASARFEVTGVAPEYKECFDIVFPFVPIFHAYRKRAESVGLFFQSRGGNIQFVDLVYFEVFHPESLELGTPITVDPLVNRDTKVAASIDVQESCPSVGVLGTSDPKQPHIQEIPQIKGTVTFDQFSQEVDGVISGTVDGSLVHPATGETVAETFSGEFEFTVQVGQPYEEFRN